MMHGHGKRQNLMKYTAKDEVELIKQLESDPELDKELEREKLVKGHVGTGEITGTERLRG